MSARWHVGELVHIPQAVELVDCGAQVPDDPQLTIPLAIHHTEKPEVGVVLGPPKYGYLRILWDGRSWSVKDNNVYNLTGDQA